jgi:beta-mannosidase
MRASHLLTPPLALVSAKHITNLSETAWTLSNNALNVSVPASLPSQAHLDLFAAGVIGDPYHDLNDFNLRWVVWHNWTYSAVLSGLSKGNDSASKRSTWLQFNGLDTFADISLCGRRVASTDNQFRQWWFDVSEIVAGCGEEELTLEMEFGSAPVVADGIAGEEGAETWPYGV